MLYTFFFSCAQKSTHIELNEFSQTETSSLTTNQLIIMVTPESPLSSLLCSLPYPYMPPGKLKMNSFFPVNPDETPSI